MHKNKVIRFFINYFSLFISLFIVLLILIALLDTYHLSYYSQCFVYDIANCFFKDSEGFIINAIPYVAAIIAIIIYYCVCRKHDITCQLKEDIFKSEAGSIPHKYNKIGFLMNINQKVSEFILLYIPILSKKFKVLTAIEILLILYLVLKYSIFNLYNSSDLIVWIITLILPAIMLYWYEGKTPDYSKLKLQKDEIFFLVCVVLFLFSILLPALTVIPYVVHYDEATIANLARPYMNGEVNIFKLNEWYGYPNFGFFPYYLVLNYISNDLWGLRLTGLISALIAVIPFYYLAKFMFNKEIAAIASIIMYSGHCFFFFFRTGMHHSDGLVLYVITAGFLILGLKLNSKLFIYLSGVFCSFGFFSYMSARVIVVIFVIYLVLLLIYTIPRRIILNHLIIYIIGFVVCFMPLSISFLKDPMKANERSEQINILVGKNAFTHASGAYKTSNETLTLINTVVHQIGISLTSFYAGKDNDRQYRLGKPFLDFISSMLYLLGLPIITFFTIGFFLPNIRLKIKFDDGITFICRLLRKTQQELAKNEKYLLISISFWLIVIFGWVLNVDPPTYQKMPILLPVLALIFAVTLYNLVNYMFIFIKKDILSRCIKKCAIGFVLVGIMFLNCEVFIHSNTVGFERDDFYLIDTIVGRYVNQKHKQDYGNYYLVGFDQDLAYTLDFFKYNTYANLKHLDYRNFVKAPPFKKMFDDDKIFIISLQYDNQAIGYNYLNYYYPNAKKIIVKNSHKHIMFILFYVPKEERKTTITDQTQKTIEKKETTSEVSG